MVTLQQIPVTQIVKFKLITCYTVEGQPKTLVLRANSSVIPKTQFQEALIAVGQLIVKDKFHKIILDADIVARLEFTSFEWYHSVWKELMNYHGVNTHCFVVPKSEVIDDEADFFEGIHLCSSIDEAVEFW
jgi:hypothetical protein